MATVEKNGNGRNVWMVPVLSLLLSAAVSFSTVAISYGKMISHNKTLAESVKELKQVKLDTNMFELHVQESYRSIDHVDKAIDGINKKLDDLTRIILEMKNE